MAGKGKRKLSVKQHKLIKALPTAASVSEAGRIAGYGTKQSTYRALESAKEKFPDLLNRKGMTDEWLADRFKAGAEGAMKVVMVEGTDIEVADHDLRFKYGWAIARMKGVDSPNDGDVRVENSAGFSVRLVVSDERAAADLARNISARRADNLVIDVDATVHTNVGRTGPGKPEQAIP